MIARNSKWITSTLAASIAAIALMTAPTAGRAQDILLGGVGPLSQPGDVAGGQELKWAMEQAVADINAKGGVMGHNLRLNFYDTQNKPDVCAAVAKKMVQDDKVVAVVGEFHSGCALAQIPTYNQAGTPVVFSETYNDKITGGDPTDPTLPANPPTIFRIAPSSTYYSDFVVDWIVNGVKAKKVAYVTDTTTTVSAPPTR
jgi:branched-chain amino acid transport system substrate-binding protein